MYVNPFIFGVICTVLIEIVGCIVYAVVETNKRGKK